MLYDLRRADVRVKWLVTGLLATLGLSYVFGAAMVALYAGFTPQSVAATYAGTEMSMPMPPETTMVVQRPMSMADFAGPEVHTVDTKLLIQDTHVHVPMYGLIAAALGVVLVKRPDAVQALLPGADAYVAREVHLSGTDAHRLHEAVDWSPEDGVLVFYGGTAGTTSVGALEFVRVDTPHGPIEVAVGFTPQGAVRGVVVTKATVEMKPWVLEAVAAGFTDQYRGLKPGGAAPAGRAAAAEEAGHVPAYGR